MTWFAYDTDLAPLNQKKALMKLVRIFEYEKRLSHCPTFLVST
ncbi:hypothetical protein VCRA2128O102_10367 [Vibrio crassostreae]|nr:hypothetical protein VCRA2113O139_20044 [Vibrio crassostreae]CAK3221877.1 hypothetical protein VCRA2128O102_10367 [Vibrio crassostreae]CAK3805955.1 hypothetical protein VCRA2128O96_10274 [Vibrio crassostreae]CDT06771.1 hypothetical protein VCR9J2_1350111 [Vibrio crassostreae]CDT07387.1 hypothetical protein VCR20J5_1240226 [Vibrio crassostreae]